MTDALTLSADSQSRINQAAEAAEGQAQAKARKHFTWSLGLFAAAAVVAAVFPPAALPGLLCLVAGTAGIVTSAYGFGHGVNAKMLSNIRKETGEAGFTDKMGSRAQRLKNIFHRSDKTSDISLYAALGLAAVALLVPPAAPVAWGLYSAAIWVMAGSTLARAVSRDANASAGAINSLTQGLATQDTAGATPANQNRPSAPALTQAPSPGVAFDKAVNAAPEAKVPAPVLAPPAPKP